MLPVLISVSITEDEETLLPPTRMHFRGEAWECVDTVADPEGETVQRGTRTVKRIRLTCQQKKFSVKQIKLVSLKSMVF